MRLTNLLLTVCKMQFLKTTKKMIEEATKIIKQLLKQGKTTKLANK